jgi:dienelactone hydrolase
MRHLKYTLSILILISAAVANGSTGATVTYDVGGRSYEGYYVSPADKAPLVLLIHDWDGLTDYEIKRSHMLADLGYAVFAMDLFGAGVRPTEVKDKRQHTGELYKDRDKMRALDDRRSSRGREHMGADVGNADRHGLLLRRRGCARVGKIRAGAEGVRDLPRRPENARGARLQQQRRASILILHGTADSAITMDQFAALANELEAAGIDHEMITYGGAQHAFTVFDGGRYQEAADMKSWKRFTEFLTDTLKK